MKKKTTAELFEKRTGVKYQNWIQAWMVTLKLERKKQMKKLLKYEPKFSIYEGLEITYNWHKGERLK